MKKIAFATILAAIGAAPALAADLSLPKGPVYTKAPPMMASPAYDWSGFYAGAHVGYDWGRAHVIDNGVLTENGVPMNGPIGGLLAGINWQSGAFVYGLEGDFGVSALQGHGHADPAFFGTPNEYDVKLSANIRSVGVTVTPTTLLYAAGGLAVAEFKFREDSGPQEVSKLLTGWTVGGGIDQVIGHNLISRVEYLYADYGHKDFAVASDDIYNIGFKTHTLRAALIGKFDPDGRNSAMASAVAGPVANWGGFYIGGDIGEAFQHNSGVSNYSEISGGVNVDNIQTHSASGGTVIGGFHAGYNWQFTPSWVVGIEGDWQRVSARSSYCRQTDVFSAACSDNGMGFATVADKTQSLSTVRGRLGYAFDRVMVYGTGGVAFEDAATELGLNCAVNGCGNFNHKLAATVHSSTVKTNWVAGAGIEWMIARNWTARAEYLHYGVGAISSALNIPSDGCNVGGPCGLTSSREFRYDIARTGISYKFGG